MGFFSRKETNNIVLTEPAVDDAIDELGLVKANNLSGAIERAVNKHLDIENLGAEYFEGDSGYFRPEFDLLGSAQRYKSIYRKEPWVNIGMNIIARTLSTIPFDVVRSDNKEIDESHPLNKTLNAGNELQDSGSLDMAVNLDAIAAGNGFLILDKLEKIIHVPVEFVTLKESKTPDRKKVSPIDGLQINSSFASEYVTELFIPWEKVFHFKLPNPYSPFVGMSMITAASRPILLDRHKNEFEMAFYLRGATNAGVVEINEDLTRKQTERLLRTFESSFTGRRNWFRSIFLPKGAKWVASGLTMTEMQHLEGLRENRLTLLACLGVPPSKVGIVQDVNRATAEVQNETFYKNTIVPLAKLKAAAWNNSYMVKRFYRGEVFVRPNFEGIEEIEGTVESRGLKAKSLDNIATINEQRKIVGLPPLKPSDPRGDMFFIQLSSLAFGNIGENVKPVEIGPRDESAGETQVVGVLSNEDGEFPHEHQAEVDSAGTGKTISTTGEGPQHDHLILKGVVEPGGEDRHTHPDIDFIDDDPEEKKNFRQLKATVEKQQDDIEQTQGRKYLKAYNSYLAFKFVQVRSGLNKEITDIRSWLQQNFLVRLNIYKQSTSKILNDSFNVGFETGENRTKSMTQFGKKIYRFTPTDEKAIEILKERLIDGRRELLALRSIDNFLGFDVTETERIMLLIDEGLRTGKTTEKIAKTIEKDYGEKYKDQAFTISRTEILTAVSQGEKLHHDILDEVFSETGKQWFHVGDVGRNPLARSHHDAFENDGNKGVVPSNYKWGGVLSYPRDTSAPAGEIINCRCSWVTVIPDDATSNAQEIVAQGR